MEIQRPKLTPSSSLKNQLLNAQDATLTSQDHLRVCTMASFIQATSFLLMDLKLVYLVALSHSTEVELPQSPTQSKVTCLLWKTWKT
jgi:hypothetical protein